MPTDPDCWRARAGEPGWHRTAFQLEVASTAAYQEAIAKIQSYGITVNGCFILGLDGDTPEVFDDVPVCAHSGLYEVQITFLTPFLHAALSETPDGRPDHPGPPLGTVHLV